MIKVPWLIFADFIFKFHDDEVFTCIICWFISCLPRDFKLRYKLWQVRIVTTIQSNFNRTRVPSKCLKFQLWKKNKKEEGNTKKWKRFSVSLNWFELDDVSKFKIIFKLVLKLLMSLRVSHEYGVLQLSY